MCKNVIGSDTFMHYKHYSKREKKEREEIPNSYNKLKD